MSPQLIPLICALILGALSAFGQNTRLTFRPVAVEWSAALGRIVMVSSEPSQLHLFDPETRTVQSMGLGATPVSLSVSPNGLYAAVGHSGSASYVDLLSRSVVRTYTYSPPPVGIGATEVVLANEWLYVLPKDGNQAISIRLSTGSATESYTSPYSGRLHPSGKAIYSPWNGAQWSDGGMARLMVEGGPIGEVSGVASETGYGHCGQTWFSPDGARIYSVCATAASYSADARLDLRRMTKFFPNRVQAFAESVTGLIATVPAQTSIPPGFTEPVPNGDHQVILVASSGFEEVGRLAIPRFAVGGTNHVGEGRWVFFNNSGTKLHLVYQAQARAGLPNDFAVQTYELANTAGCAATLSTGALTVGSEGTLHAMTVQSAVDCAVRLESPVDWVQVVYGVAGSGIGNVRLHIRANTGGARTATLVIGTQTLQISQAGALPAVPGQQRFSYKVKDVQFSKSLDRVVLAASSPREVHLYDPVTRQDQHFALPYAPLSLSVSPDGRKAAVGHSGFVSIVNLETRTVEKLLQVGMDVKTVLLTGEQWAYLFSDRAGKVVEVATGITRDVNNSQDFARLHASGNWAYVGNLYSWSRLDVRSGGNTAMNPVMNVTCGNLWMSEDGLRHYTACGDVYRSSEVPGEDGTAIGRFAKISRDEPGAAWVAHSSARRQAAVLAGPSDEWRQLIPADVQLYNDEGLGLTGRMRMQPRVEGGLSYPLRGRRVFWNQRSNRLYAVAQIDDYLSRTLSESPPLADYSLEVFSPEVIEGCTATVNSQNFSIDGERQSVQVGVQGGAGCVWEASVEQPGGWVQIFVRQSGTWTYTGAGMETLLLLIDYNATGAPRTTSVRVGGVRVTLNQGLPKPYKVSPSSIKVAYSGATTTFDVTTSSPGLTWTAESKDEWITLMSGPNFTGSQSVAFRVARNTGATRLGRIMAAGEAILISQDGAPLSSGMLFVPVAPCRVVDTRGLTGEVEAFGVPVMEGGTQRDFPIPQGKCGIPPIARAYSLNATVVPRGPLSYLTLWPAGQSRPLVSTLNSFDGRIKANAAIVPAGLNGAVSAFVTDRTDLILDINGYFVPSLGSTGAYPFYPETPCRVVDTRDAAGPYGAPHLAAGETRNFKITGTCNGRIISLAKAFALNVTVIPRSGPLSYLTIWPAGSAQPVVSTLNSPTGTVVANAAIVPAGADGSVSVFVTEAADLVIDINGYFSTLGFGTPLAFVPMTPCRLADTRNAPSEFGGPALAAGGTRMFPVLTGVCGVRAEAKAYSMNATVVPSGPLPYLTVWPAGVTQPLVSTLNSFDGTVVANALLAPGGYNGAIQAFVPSQTHLILDLNGFFVP